MFMGIDTDSSEGLLVLAGQNVVTAISHLLTTGLEDWSLVLWVCQDTSKSKSNAKEASRVLLTGLKYVHCSLSSV
jgi:hypothetical protein